MSARRSATLIALAMLVPLALPLIPTAYAAANTGVFGAGEPTFINYPGPSYLDSNGEPTVGVDWNTGAVMLTGSHFTNLAKHAKAVFNDAVNPPTVTWSDVTPTPEDGMPVTGWGVGNVDPILWTDHDTGRTWVGGIDGTCSVLYISDNDGGSWLPGGNSCVATVDHETIGTGPFHDPKPPSATGYPNQVYYCAQAAAVTCTVSYDGGETYPVTAPVPCESDTPGLHGHVQVMRDGTAWLPFDQETAHLCIAHSEDNGQSWSDIVLPNATPSGGFDPAIATTPHNWLYLAYPDASGRTHVALSKDHGASFSYSRDLGSEFGLKTTTFHTMLAGDDDRAAVAFLGTTMCCVSNAFSDHNWKAVWNLYVSYTYDGGQTWTTYQASADPVQRGCIWDGGGSDPCRNLLDFMGADVDKQGRVVIEYPDGCLGACAGPTGTTAQSTSALGTVARQTTGKGLFAAYDAAGVTVTTAPSGVAGTATTLVADLTGMSPFSAAISWGDGTPLQGLSNIPGPTLTVQHTYATAGTFPIAISITDNGGRTASTTSSADVSPSTSGGGSGTIHITSPSPSDTVNDAVHVVGTVTASVSNTAPVAAFTSSVSGNTVSVDGSSSSDANGDTLTYAWTFGDSSAGSGATTSHTYAGPGTYNVCLVVSDGSLTNSVCHAVTIAPTTTTDLITTDPAGDAKNAILMSNPNTAQAAQNVPALDILKVEATTNANQEPVFILTLADLSTDMPVTEAGNGLVWRADWTGPTGDTNWVSAIANTMLANNPDGTLECVYGIIDKTTGTSSSEGSAVCTVQSGPNGKLTMTYPAAGLGAHGYTPTTTLVGFHAHTGVFRGKPPTPAVSGGSSTITYDDTASTDYALHMNANAAFAHLGLRATAVPRAAPTTVPANAQIRDHVDDTPFESNPASNVEAAWFDSDANYLYVGLKVQDIPADPRTTSYTTFAVDFLPTYEYDDGSWGGHVPNGATLNAIEAFAALQPVTLDLANTPPAPPGVNQADSMSFELHETDTDPTTGSGHFGIIGTVTGSIDPNTDIIWWQIPRTMLQNPPGGGVLGTTSAASGFSVLGAGTLNGIDSTGTGEDFTFPTVHVDPPVVTLSPDHATGLAPLSVTFAASATTAASIATWTFAAGDGATSNGAGAPPAVFTHIYTTAGSYTARLSVVDSQGNPASASTPITVSSNGGGGSGTIVQVSAGGLPPVTANCPGSCANWDANLDLSSLAAGPVTLDAKLITNNNVVSEATVSVTLARTSPAGVVIDTPLEGARLTPGQVNVTGRVTGSSDLAPTAHLMTDVQQGVAPLTVTFTVDGNDDHGIVGWSLDTRDGAVPTGTSVPSGATHTYPAGDFDPILTVRDAAGHTATSSVHIHVSASNIPPTTPSSPSPADGATGVPVSTTLSWVSTDGNGDALSFDVYLDTTDGSTLVASHQTSAYSPPTLATGTTYSWHVVASDGTASVAGPTWTFTTVTGALTEAQKPHVVVGETDTGVNPYNMEFRRAELTQNPQEYITGLTNVHQINLCFFDNTTKTVHMDNAGCPASAVNAPDQDAAEWAKIKLTARTDTGPNQGNLYWFAGTNIMALSFDGAAGFYTLDGSKNPSGATSAPSEHGTATSSNVVGKTTGTCPECFDVVLQAGLDNDLIPAYTWLSNQPYLDVITSSVSCGPVPTDVKGTNPLCGAPSSGTHNAVTKGKLFFESSGNGVGDLGLSPTSTVDQDNFNPWTIAVGCSATTKGDMCLYSDTPNAIEATGVDRDVAGIDTYTGRTTMGGTSFSSPSSAGVAARAIYEMRAFYGDTQEGPSVASSGDYTILRLNGHPAPSQGPMKNGILTREELEEVLFKTARRDFLSPDAGLSFISAYTGGTPVSFVKEGYGEVYHGLWGVNGPGAVDSWASTGDMVSVLKGDKALPLRPVEQFWWDSVVTPAQEQVYGADHHDADNDGFPRTDAMDPNNLGGYRPTMDVGAATPKIPAVKAAIPDGVTPTPTVNRLYLHHADLGPDPASVNGNHLYDMYLNTIADPGNHCTGTGCADSSGIGATGVSTAGFSKTYTAAHPQLGGAIVLDTTKDITVHVEAVGFGGVSNVQGQSAQNPAASPVTMTFTLLTGSGEVLVGTASPTASHGTSSTVYEATFKPIVGVITDPLELQVSWGGPAYSSHILSQGKSWIDLPIAADVGPQTPATPITYYLEHLATSWQNSGDTVTLTRDATALQGDADLGGTTFFLPQGEGEVVNLQSDDMLSTQKAILAPTGTATVYVCPGLGLAGAANINVEVTLAAGDIVLGSGSLTQVVTQAPGVGVPPTFSGTAFAVPLAMHPALVPLNAPLTGSIRISDAAGVATEAVGTCGGTSSQPWKIDIATSPLAVPTATIGSTPATLTGSVQLSGDYAAPARPDLSQVVWYAQDLGDWSLVQNTFVLDTNGPGTASGGPILPPSPTGYQLTFTSARPLAQDAPALSANGVGTVQFWVDSIGPSPATTIDASVFLQDSAGHQRLVGQGSASQNVGTKELGAIPPTPNPVPQARYVLHFTPLVTDPKPDEVLVLSIDQHNAGPAAVGFNTCFCGAADEPVFVSLPKAIDATATAKSVDINIGALHATGAVSGSTWSATIDSRAIANGAQTLSVTPKATYAGELVQGLPVTKAVTVSNAIDTPPTASLSLSTLTAIAPASITATMTGTDAETLAPLLRWKIHWSDGSSDDSGTGVPATKTHTYSASGTYTVTLTITDTSSQIATSSQTLTVVDAQPVEQVLVSLDGGSPIAATDASGSGDLSSWYALFDVQTTGLHTIHVDHMSGANVLASADSTFSIAKSLHVSITAPAGDSIIDEGATLAGQTDATDAVTGVIASLTPDFATSVAATSSDAFATWSLPIDALGLTEDQPTTIYVKATTVNESAGASESLTLNARPNAAIDVLSTLPAYTQSDVSFHGEAASAASGAAISAWHWEFGDNSAADTMDATHQYAHSGAYTATLTVTDANGKTDTASAPVLILDQAPSVGLSSDPASPTDLETATLSATATDADGTAGAPFIQVHSGSDASSSVLASGTGTLSFRFPDNGVYYVDAASTDNEGVTGTTHILVSVLNVRPDAILTASASLVAVGKPVTLDASGSSDPDGSIASYHFDFGDGQSVTITADHIDHEYDASGTYHVTVTVTDNDGSSIESAPVDVIANAAPVFQGLVNQIVAEGGHLAFTVAATDQENDPLTYSVGTLPSGASFDAASQAFDWTPDFGQAGNYPVTFTVTDGHSDTTKTIIVSVGDVDRPPVLDTIGPKSGAEASPIGFTLTGSDPDLADILHYTMTGAPSGATLGRLTGVFAWTPSYTQAGVYHVTFKIDDGNLSATEDVTFTIANTDRAPTLNALLPASILQLSTLSIPLTASDPDADALSFVIATPLDGLTVANDGNGHGRLIWTPTLAELGPYTVTVLVTDGELSAARTVVLTSIFNTSETLVHTSSSFVSVSPGQTTTLVATLTNTGPQRDTFEVTAANTQGWVLGALPAPITLEPGQSAQIHLDVTADGSKPVSYTTIFTRSLGDGTTIKSARFRVDIPVVVEITAMGHLTNAADMPVGTVHVTHLDGTPAVNAQVKVDQMPPQLGGLFESAQTGSTDTNGDFHFDFSKDPKALTPGKHQLVITANKVGGFTTMLATRYDIGPAVN